MILDLRSSNPAQNNSALVVVLFDETITDMTNGECLGYEDDCVLEVHWWPETGGGTYSSDNPLILNYAQELFLNGDSNDVDSIHHFRIRYDCVLESCDQTRDVKFQLIGV